MQNVKDWLFKTKDGKYVTYELPNVPIILAALFYFISALSEDDIANFTELIGRTFLIFWALLELSQGANKFRRLLGATVLIFIVINIIS